MVVAPGVAVVVTRWRTASAALGALLLAGCGRLDELAYVPTTTPVQWCEQRPCTEVAGRVLDEPMGTALVALLAVAWIGSGLYFLLTRRGQRSRTWLGTAFILGGIGAASAGWSYQAFGYELKCAGFDTCRLTDGWEVAYSVLQAASVSAMVVAVAYACARGGLRRGLIWYAGLNVVVYLVVTALGVLLPSRVLLSFEVLMLFAVPGIVLVIATAWRHRRETDDALPRRLVAAAVLLVVVQVAYFAYYAAGIGPALWDDGRGPYLTANDVLHLGMLLWLAYVVAAVGPVLADASSPSTSGAAEVPTRS